MPAAITLTSQIASGYFAVTLNIPWLNSAWYLPYMIIAVPFAVAWTRFVLHGPALERVSFLPRFGSREINYLGVSILLVLATIAAPLAITIILFSLDSAGAAFGPLIVLDALTFILAIFAGLRLSFALPAIAVARFGGLACAWRQTEGAALRIFAINLLVLLPLTIAQYSAAALASFLG
ncbi:MAG: hypothetical protein ACREQB_11690, partial [Candidatus Binataceae bacterium]